MGWRLLSKSLSSHINQALAHVFWDPDPPPTCHLGPWGGQSSFSACRCFLMPGLELLEVFRDAPSSILILHPYLHFHPQIPSSSSSPILLLIPFLIIIIIPIHHSHSPSSSTILIPILHPHPYSPLSSTSPSSIFIPIFHSPPPHPPPPSSIPCPGLSLPSQPC